MLPFRQSDLAFASDIIPELVALWLAIRDRPSEVADGYRDRWEIRQREGHTAYYVVRDRFNRTRDPIDFLFLSRTCVNGLIRFNRSGEFNNSLHHTRPGIDPDTFEGVIANWSLAVQGVNFRVADYKDALSDVEPDDFVFLDPPYEATRGRYLPGTVQFDEFYVELARLNDLGAKWILTYDGQAGKREYKVALPPELYQSRIGITTGNSPFTRLMGTTLDSVVESVYLNYEPPRQLFRDFTKESGQPCQLSVTFDMEDRSTPVPIELEGQD